MRGAGVLAFVLLGTLEGLVAEYLNNKPYPTYSLENMPDTEFTCRDKVLGGYYADLDTECQMFHICVKVAGVGVQDFRFLCPNGTAFDQDHQICAEWNDVDCDASTLYYSSDNFDLYRIGSGFESKAVRYGEDEEPFALQHAETGDLRVNREKETQRINQKKDYNTAPPRPFKKTTPKPQKPNNDNEKDIFKGSSSGHFFNNRNNGKETDEDYDDENVNVNQNEDRFQTRKINRKPSRNQYNNFEQSTQGPRRPTAFVNNFAGSSYIPTTSKPSTTTGINYRHRQNQNNYYKNNQQTSSTPTFTVSTPAPFRQNSNGRGTIQYNNNYDSGQYNNNYDSGDDVTENYPKQKITKEKENYPTSVAPPSTQKYYNTQYKTKTTEPENYPTSAFDNQKQKNLKKTDNYPTTYAPKNTASQKANYPATNTQTTFDNNYPTTFSPRTNAGFAQIAQQTTKKETPQPSSAPTSTLHNPQNYYSRQTTNEVKNTQTQTTQQQTQSTQFTQYTPTVPKVTTKYTTTPAPKFSNRYDETQYDENVDDSKDEFLSAAHSTNIANSRNELVKSTKVVASPTTTQKPRPFSLTTTRSAPQTTPKAENQPSKAPVASKKPKDYDYAYYDTNVSDSLDYDVHADIKKSEKTKQ